MRRTDDAYLHCVVQFVSCISYLLTRYTYTNEDEAGANATVDSTYDIIFSNSIWAPLTVVFISDANIGASFQVSILRFFGTVTGALFGSFLDIFLADAPAGQIVGLTLWAFMCCLLQKNPRYGYAAQV